MRISSYFGDGRTHHMYTNTIDPTGDNFPIGTKWYNTTSKQMFIYIDDGKWTVYTENIDKTDTISISAAPSTTIPIDCSTYDMFILYDFDSNITLDFTNFDIGRSINIAFDMSGGYTVTYPSDVYWVDGEIPALSDGSTLMDHFVITKVDTNRIYASGILGFEGNAYVPPVL